jgi:hypothetical protein
MQAWAGRARRDQGTSTPPRSRHLPAFDAPRPQCHSSARNATRAHAGGAPRPAHRPTHAVHHLPCIRHIHPPPSPPHTTRRARTGAAHHDHRKSAPTRRRHLHAFNMAPPHPALALREIRGIPLQNQLHVTAPPAAIFATHTPTLPTVSSPATARCGGWASSDYCASSGPRARPAHIVIR